MDELQIDLPGSSAWAVSMALVNEFIASWRAEVQEYDVTPTGGVITLALPNDREFRMARARARGEHAARVLARSNEILRDAQNRAIQARACLLHIQSHLAA